MYLFPLLYHDLLHWLVVVNHWHVDQLQPKVSEFNQYTQWIILVLVIGW